MKTIDLRLGTRNKLKIIDAALQDTCHISHNPLTYYFAAKGAVDAQRRVGFERRFNATRQALKAFNVTVTPFSDERAGQFVRIFIPTKQLEIILGD